MLSSCQQTGADRLTLGGALGANIHGRGLALKPIIGDVESFTLMHADGSLSTCSRSENRELFGLAIGGYGLFGVVTRVRLRLRARTKLERVVRIIDIDDLMAAFAERIDDGYLYGDCQFSTDASSDTYLRKGVFACYRPLPADAPMPADQKELGEAQWRASSTITRTPTRDAPTMPIPRITCRLRGSATGPTSVNSASILTIITPTSTAG